MTAGEALENNESYRIASGQTYDWAFTPAGESAAGAADDAWVALINAAPSSSKMISFSLHTAEVSGTAYTANELTTARNNSYARQTVAFAASKV